MLSTAREPGRKVEMALDGGKPTPTFDDVLDKLRQVADIPDLEPDTSLQELGIDSLDALEWFYLLDDTFGIKIEDTLTRVTPTMSARGVYHHIIAPAITLLQ
jgi:acyl carrier protein